MFGFKDFNCGFEGQRAGMVRSQLRDRGITDGRVLAAMGRVPRERFVPPERGDAAYADAAVAIGGGQTISQPYMVAIMSQLLGLDGGERVLEVGTGSGYQTAVLAELVRADDAGGKVFTVERLAELSERARAVLAKLGYDNIEFRVGDGSTGWAEQAPFDAIIMTAASPTAPAALIEQLAAGGRFVGPIGPADTQTLVQWTRQADGTVRKRNVLACRFVPLIGLEGY